MLCDTRNSDSHWVVGDEMNLVAVGEVFYPALCVDGSTVSDYTDLQIFSLLFSNVVLHNGLIYPNYYHGLFMIWQNDQVCQPPQSPAHHPEYHTLSDKA